MKKNSQRQIVIVDDFSEITRPFMFIRRIKVNLYGFRCSKKKAPLRIQKLVSRDFSG